MAIDKYPDEMRYSELTEEEWGYISERIRPRGNSIIQGKEYTYIFIEEAVTLGLLHEDN